MSSNRVRIAKNKAEFVKSLTQAKENNAPFDTYADVVAFAAALGVKRHRRIPLEDVSQKDPAPIGLEIFISRGYDALIKLLAIAEVKDPNILSPFAEKAEEQRLEIFEEYANGGLELLQESLRGQVDYSQGILLLLMSERGKKNSTTEEFDLSRFL